MNCTFTSGLLMRGFVFEDFEAEYLLVRRSDTTMDTGASVRDAVWQHVQPDFGIRSALRRAFSEGEGFGLARFIDDHFTPICAATILHELEEHGDHGQFVVFRKARVFYSFTPVEPLVDEAPEAEQEAPNEEEEKTPIPQSTIVVKVVDEDGNPIQHADVKIEGKIFDRTKAAGRSEIRDLGAGKYNVGASTPGYRAAGLSETLTEDSCSNVTIVLKRINVALVYPPQNSTHIQYVNLPKHKNEQDHGSELVVELRVIDGKAGDTVYLKFEYDVAKVHPRKVPREVKGGVKEAWCPQGGQIRTLKTDDEIIKIPIKLGFCGGDTFTIGVGGTDACNDMKCTVINWRKLYYEIWEPDAASSSFSQMSPIKAKVDSLMNAVLADSFIEFKENNVVGGTVFVKDELPKKGIWNVIPSEHFGKPPGKKVLILSRDQSNKILAKRSKALTNKLVVTSIWMDYQARPEKKNKPDQAGVTSACWLLVPDEFVALPRALDNHLGLKHGDYTITKLQWKVTHWYDVGSAPVGHEVTNATWPVGTPMPLGWKRVTSADDPGGKFRDYTTLSEPLDLQDNVWIKGTKTLELKLPTKRSFLSEFVPADGYPGHDLPLDNLGRLTCDGKLVAIDVQTEMVAYSMESAGSAIYGSIWMTTQAGNNTPEGIAHVMLHELAHNMGQTYMKKADAPTYGRSAVRESLSSAEGFPPMPAVPGGFTYEGKGHTGPHCAQGLGATQRGKAKFTGLHGVSSCIMFGASDMNSNNSGTFCADCIKQHKGEDLSNIRSNWYK